MNISNLNNSLQYICNNFSNIVSISQWIYQELITLKYTDRKLSKAFRIRHDFEIAESIIHLNINKDILSDLLLEVLDEYRINDFYRRTKLLLEHDAINVHLKDELILRRACRLGYPNLVKMLLTYNPDVNTHLGYCINAAFINNDSEIAELLLEAGVKIDLINIEVIKTTCSFRRSKLIKLLIKYGVYVQLENIDQQDDDVIDLSSFESI